MTSRNLLARRTPFGGMPVGAGFVGVGDTLTTDCSTLEHRRSGTFSWRSTTPTSAFAPKLRGSRRISRIWPTAVDTPLVFNPLFCATQQPVQAACFLSHVACSPSLTPTRRSHWQVRNPWTTRSPWARPTSSFKAVPQTRFVTATRSPMTITQTARSTTYSPNRRSAPT